MPRSSIALLALLLLAAPAPAQEDTLRVFFMGRSEFGASGGIPSPFHEVCELAGVACSAHRHWDFVEHDRSNGLPPSYRGMAENRHVRRILSTESFDVVYFSFFAYNTEFYDPAPAYTDAVLTGAESIYRQIVAGGAEPFVNVGYATLDNPGDTARIAEGAALMRRHLEWVAREGGTAPARFVPGGSFFGEMARELGPERWFADPLHASELGQYAMARFFFTCITGRDPTGFGHPPRISEADRRRIDAGILRHGDGCRVPG